MRSKRRECSSRDRDGWWLLLRRPLLLALFLGSGVSLLSSGRLTPRLVVDGAISFAFVPIVELAAFAVVYRRRSHRLPEAREIDRFFTTNEPWLLSIVALSALVSLQPPRAVGLWAAPPLMWLPLAAIALAIGWSAHRDVRYFREAFQRPASGAWRDAILLRAIAWPVATIYFLGIAIWPTVGGWFWS
jgi:hypothetical protein